MEVLESCEFACLPWKKRKQADGNLLIPEDGFPKAVPWILFFWKRRDENKLQKHFFPTVTHCSICIWYWIYGWHYLIESDLEVGGWLSLKISSVPVVISFLAFCSTFTSYLITWFQHSLFRNIICISFNGKAGVAFCGGLLSCTSTPYQRYSSASYVKHFEIWMEFINC